MKRGLAILLLTLFLFNMFGYYFVFSYNRYLLRNEMRSLARAGYFEGSGILLKIKDVQHEPGFKRLDKNEFVYNGMLYDILAESTSGNTTTFKCINDIKEEKLLAEFHNYLDQTVSHNDPVKAKHAQAMLRHLITLALVEYPLTHPSQVPFESKFFIYSSPLVSVPRISLFHPPSLS
jgi:hypothetical protein